MKPEKRAKIIEEYGVASRKANKSEEANIKMAFPESFLPYSKREIRKALNETLKEHEKIKEKIKKRFKTFSKSSREELYRSTETLFEGTAMNLDDVINYIKALLENLNDFIPDKKWKTLSDDPKTNIIEWAKRRQKNKDK